MEKFTVIYASVLFLSWRQSLCSPTPQFFNFPSGNEPISNFGAFQQPPEPEVSGIQERWRPRQLMNETNRNIDPVSTVTDDMSRRFVQPRQVPLSSTTTYPQIFKVDDFIIISNPKPARPQPCIPPSRPPFIEDDGLQNRLNDQDGVNEPSKCVWSIIACCSPGSRNIRYACFELLGCPGAFWDVNPCDDKVVMAAATVALNFYSQRTNSTLNSPYPPSS